MPLLSSEPIYIYNSLKGEKEVFTPTIPEKVGIYVCGPTVYSNVHLGNCRTFLSFDTVVRYFKYLGYQVRYVRNITDAGHLENDAEEGEDKIAKKARIEQLEPMEIVQHYTVDFHNVMAKFNALPPSIEPTATGHIIEQIETIETIMNKGLAYEVNGSVYFDVKKYIEQGYDYGELSGRDIDELMSGSRDLDGQQEKKNSVDFALWKKASPMHIMRWSSPWGVGFPGWHLECSVMGNKYLGKQFDIHGGGMDLKFPHHECEIAQGQAANSVEPVKYWMHGNMLTLNGKRMSKSTGNTLLPEELFTGNNGILEKAFHPMVVRFFMLQAHYRSVLDFSSDALMAAEKGFKKLMDANKLLNNASFDYNQIDQNWNDELSKALDQVLLELNDDFNTPKAIAVMFDIVSKINTMNDKNTWSKLDEATVSKLKSHFTEVISEVFGLLAPEENNSSVLNDSLQVLLDIRAQAKRDRNFALADEIRDKLNAAGVNIKDGKDGSTFTIK